MAMQVVKCVLVEVMNFINVYKFKERAYPLTVLFLDL